MSNTSIKERKIPLKNYIILIIIYIITFLAVFYAIFWYNNYKVNRLTTPYIQNKINSISYEELDNYIIEYPNTIIYIGKNNDENCYNTEKNLYSVLRKNNLIENTVFLDLSTNYSDTILDNISNKYFDESLKDKELKVPSIIIINDKKIKDFVTVYNDLPISNDRIHQILEEFEFIKW